MYTRCVKSWGIMPTYNNGFFVSALACWPTEKHYAKFHFAMQVNTSIPGNGLAELIAEKTGMPPALVQGAFLVAGASLVVSIGLSLIATLAVPALFTSLLALPAILALTGIVLAFGAVLGGLLPVLVTAQFDVCVFFEYVTTLDRLFWEFFLQIWMPICICFSRDWFEEMMLLLDHAVVFLFQELLCYQKFRDL